MAGFRCFQILLLKIVNQAGDGQIGALTVIDISKSGEQIAEKLFTLLNAKQRQELTQYILAKEERECSVAFANNRTLSASSLEVTPKLTEIHAEDLYFCLENRLVCIGETEIRLTAKEFDIFALLIMNPHRVLTYDMIIDLVWHEDLDYYSRRAINNHVSNLRQKLKITPETPNYIRSVHSIGYKFNPNIEIH